MNKHFKRLAILLMLLLTHALYAEQADSQVRFNFLDGLVETSSQTDNGNWQPATRQQVIYAGDHIRAGTDASAILQQQDLHTIILKPDSEIVIETPPSSESRITLISGRIWFNAKKMFSGGTVKIEMGETVAEIRGTNITCNREGHGDDETAGITAFRGQADLFIPNTGEHFIVEEGQQLTIRGGQAQREQIDIQQQQSQWQNQVDQLGSSLGLDDIPDVLRGIRENEGNTLRNLRASMGDLTPENAPALSRTVERFIGVLDEDAMILANLQRRIQQSLPSAPASERARLQGLMSAVADVTRSNQANRAEIAQILRQLRDATAIDLGDLPGRIERIRVSAANGFQAVSEQFAALPADSTAETPAVSELRTRIAEFQAQLAQFEAELLRIQRQLSDVVNTQSGTRVAQARTLAREGAAVLQAIGGYRQGLQRFNVARQTEVADEEAQTVLQRLGGSCAELAEEINSVNERFTRSLAVFEQARAVVITPGLGQDQYLDAREELQATIDGDLSEAGELLEEMAAEQQELNQQKQDLLAQYQEKINRSTALRALANDLNRRFSEISTQLAALTTSLAKLRSEQSSLLAALSVKPVDDTVITRMQDTEDAMSNALTRFENDMSAYNAIDQTAGSAARDRLRGWVRLLDSFQKVRRLYLSAQRLYESQMRGMGRAVTTRELEELQATWERISDDFQRLSIVASSIEAELNRLESELGGYMR